MDVEHRGRLPVLDYIRATSILIVLATHGLPLGPRSWQLNLATGPLGMSLFFVLSGFLITLKLARDPDAVAFLITRFCRIVPLAYTYAFVVFAVIFHDP
ncbi:MAG: acyltransferase, partial [Proteobacteria bacterium]|nr:acyltransferase [Pseudomonadota bacterium]